MTYWDEYGDEPDDGEGDDDVEYFTDDEIAGAAAAGGGGDAGGDGPQGGDDDGGDARRGGPRWLELIVAIVAAIAVVALIVTLTSDDDDDDGDEVATQEDSTTSSSRRTTTTRRTTTSSSSTTIGVDPASTIAGAGGSSSTTASGGSSGGGSNTTKKPTTTAAPIGTVYPDEDPDCATASSGGPQAPFAGWPQLWQTEPKTNQPTKINVCVDDATPAVGQLVTVSVRGDDEDAQFDSGRGCGWDVKFNGEAPQTCGATFPEGPQPTPPTRFGGGFFREATFTYTGPGTYTIRAKVVSGVPGPINPYSGEASASLTVTVHG